MNRWLAIAVRTWIAGGMAALAFALLSGCQPTYLSKDVFVSANAGLPMKICADDRCPITEPIAPLTAAPPTINSADRLPRYLTLQEAIAIALESGTVTGRGVSNLGLLPAPGSGAPSTNAVGFPVVTQNDNVRILAMLPAISNANIELSASKFDAVFTNYMIWNGVDSLLGVPNNANNFQDNSIFGSAATTGGQSGRWGAALTKALASGGVASVGMLVDYRALNNNATNPVPGSGLLNPQYTARFQMGFEQPLLRDFGVFINQILPVFPSATGQGLPSSHEVSAFNQHQNKAGSDGILIARIKFDQSRAHFENNVHALLANVELAYWDLYQKYGQLYSYEESLRIIHKAWQENYDRLQFGGKDPPEYFQIKGQFDEFRGQRTRAFNEVLAAERNLRSILGLPVEDGSRLVPITPPTLSELKPDWQTSLQEALISRPDLAWARQEVAKSQLNLAVQKNNLHPDLRLIARAEPYGDGSSLTGNGTFFDNAGTAQPTNAFRSLMNGRLLDYQVGVVFNMPLGFRAEYAALRAARLQLTQTYLLLKDWETQVTFQLAKEYADLESHYKLLQHARGERNGYGEAVRLRLVQIGPGGKNIIGDPAFLEAHRRYTTALVKEYQAIADYNNSLARLEWAKGSIMRYDNVHIAEGGLPQCAQVRAVEYEKERSRSIVCKTRPDSMYQPGRLCGMKGSEPALTAPSLLEEKQPAVEKQEWLPLPPRKLGPVQEEERAPAPLPPITTTPKEGVKQIEFRPKQPAAPKVEPIQPKELPTLPKLEPVQPRELPPLPKLEPMRLIPKDTGTAPSNLKPIAVSSLQQPRQPGAAGFVSVDDLQLTPTPVRTGLAEPQRR